MFSNKSCGNDSRQTTQVKSATYAIITTRPGAIGILAYTGVAGILSAITGGTPVAPESAFYLNVSSLF